MSIVRTKPSFSSIWESIQQIDTTVGVFLFKDSSVKRTFKEKILMLTVPAHKLILTLFIVSTLIITKFKLIHVILSISAITIFLSLYVGILKMIKHKDMLKDLLTWCENLYDLRKKEVIHENIEKHLRQAEVQTMKMFKYLKFILYGDAVCVSIGFPVVGYFLPEKIYPAFTPPLPFFLPFKQQQSWSVFLPTLILQIVAVVNTATIVIYVFGVFFCIVIHILQYLDIILEIIEELKQQLLKGGFSKDVQRPKLSKNNLLPFDEWIKTLTDMITDVNDQISSLGNFFSELFFLLEIASLASLFMGGLVFTVVRQQYVFGAGITLTTFILFIVCHINEKILEKFENLKKAMYDMPWYELDQKQNKMLMIALNCDQLQGGFTAAGIHSLTLERFGIIVKAAYTNLLVLKDLVQK